MKTNRRIPSIKLNDQAAMDYALYMMMSSFFKKVESLSPIFEEQLLLRYRTQSAKSQEVMENMCVGAVDHYLPLVLPDYIQNCQVQASFRRGNADGVTTFIFDGGIFTLELFAKINGARRTLIGYVFQEEALPGNSEYIFHDKKGSPIQRDSYIQNLGRRCKRLNINCTHNHAFRVAFNSRLIGLGFSSADRALILGHEVQTNEANYSVTDKRHLADLHKKLTGEVSHTGNKNTKNSVVKEEQ